MILNFNSKKTKLLVFIFYTTEFSPNITWAAFLIQIMMQYLIFWYRLFLTFKVFQNTIWLTINAFICNFVQCSLNSFKCALQIKSEILLIFLCQHVKNLVYVMGLPVFLFQHVKKLTLFYGMAEYGPYSRCMLLSLFNNTLIWRQIIFLTWQDWLQTGIYFILQTILLWNLQPSS